MIIGRPRKGQTSIARGTAPGIKTNGNGFGAIFLAKQEKIVTKHN